MPYRFLKIVYPKEINDQDAKKFLISGN